MSDKEMGYLIEEYGEAYLNEHMAEEAKQAIIDYINELIENAIKDTVDIAINIERKRITDGIEKEMGLK